jgi:GAF domain-containing protein
MAADVVSLPVRPRALPRSSDATGIRLEPTTLYEIIELVGSSPNLQRVLDGVVTLVTDATDCHACLIYLRHGNELRLTAASRGFGHLIGRIVLGIDEGLTGWAARTCTSAIIRDHATDDPRVLRVPELERESKWQSMVAVPVPTRSGDAIGVVVLHAEAPREFDQGALSFLEHTASLVAGAIENGRLFEDAQRRVDALTALTKLGQRIAAVTEREDLYRTVAEGVRQVLHCRMSALEVTARNDGRSPVVLTDPPDVDGVWTGAPTGVDEPRAVLMAPISAGDETLGLLRAGGDRNFTADEDEMLRTVASQVAVAMKRIELVERLTIENRGRQVLDALAADDAALARARARVAGIDLDQPYLVVQAANLQPESRPWAAVAVAVEAALRRAASSTTCDVGAHDLRAIVPLRGRQEELRSVQDLIAESARAERLHIGMAYVAGLEQPAVGLSQAADARTVAAALLPDGGALSYEELGAYKYLVRLSPAHVPDPGHAKAIARVIEYDRRRKANLIQTLEEYLEQGRAPVVTARSLYIHPNTLRQRLERVEKVTGLSLANENALSLQLAIKLARLRGDVLVPRSAEAPP